jgi:hypothetical protein
MDNMTLSAKLQALRANMETRRKEEDTAIAGIERDIAQLSTVAALLGSSGAVVIPPKRTRRSKAEIEAAKAAGVA